MTDQEVADMAGQILWFADPRLIKILMKGDRRWAFCWHTRIFPPRCRKPGAAWPFGWVRLLRELKRTDWININGAGIIAEYRGMGGTAVLFDEMAKSVRGGRYVHADLVQIGLENDACSRN